MKCLRKSRKIPRNSQCCCFASCTLGTKHIRSAAHHDVTIDTFQALVCRWEPRGFWGGFLTELFWIIWGWAGKKTASKNCVEKPVKNPIDQFNGRSTCTYCNSELFSHQKKLVSQRAIELQRRRWCLSGVPAWGCKNEMENIYKKGIVTSIQRICRREFPCFFRLSEINITPVVVDARWQQVVRKWSENGWKKSKI